MFSFLLAKEVSGTCCGGGPLYCNSGSFQILLLKEEAFFQMLNTGCTVKVEHVLLSGTYTIKVKPTVESSPL